MQVNIIFRLYVNLFFLLVWAYTKGSLSFCSKKFLKSFFFISMSIYLFPKKFLLYFYVHISISPDFSMVLHETRSRFVNSIYEVFFVSFGHSQTIINYSSKMCGIVYITNLVSVYVYTFIYSNLPSPVGLSPE